jgi:hypothetical protein
VYISFAVLSEGLYITSGILLLGEKMTAIVTVRGKKYVWLNQKCVAELPFNNEEFAEKIVKAYHGQVVCNGGWGFTVKYKGYRIRFDLANATRNSIPQIYQAIIEEEPMLNEDLN